MVSIQGVAAEMLTSRKTGGCDPSDDSISCSRLLGGDSGTRNTYSLARLTGLYASQLFENLKRCERLTSGRGIFQGQWVGLRRSE